MKQRGLRAFRMVMLTGSMTTAARELNTTQPNVSRLIGQLEQEVGFALFHRGPTGLVSTFEGKEFFRHVERLFGGFAALENEAEAIRRFGTRQLRIATIPTLAFTVLPDTVAHFRADQANMRLTIETSDSRTIADLVGAGYCDFGLVSHIPSSPGVSSEKIYTARCVCVVPRGHRLADRERVEAADLDGEEFLSISSGSGTRKMIDSFFREGREDKRILSLETPFGATICVMVGLGLGLGIVSELVARASAQRSWVVVPFEPELYIRSYLLRNARKALPIIAESFVQSLEGILASRPYQEGGLEEDGTASG